MSENKKTSPYGVILAILASLAVVFFLLWVSGKKDLSEVPSNGSIRGGKFYREPLKTELVEDTLKQKDEQIIALEAALKAQKLRNAQLCVIVKSSDKAELLSDFDNEEEEKDYQKASPEEMAKKIKWNYGKERLEHIFLKLAIGNSIVGPLLKKKQVMEFLQNNFSCYDHKPTGRKFCPSYKYKYTLEGFIFQVYKTYKNHRGEKTAYATLLVDNFEQWRDEKIGSLKVSLSRALQDNKKGSPYVLWIDDRMA